MTKSATAKTSTSLLGAAAEHYVMCQLLRRGKLAALAPIGAPLADIIVSDRVGGALSAVQVKARTYGKDGGWHMSVKHESPERQSVLYCFVDFGIDLGTPPKTWIVPGAVVALALKTSYEAWLAKPGKGGKPHKKYDGRRFRPDYDDLALTEYAAGWLEQYAEAWGHIAPSKD